SPPFSLHTPATGTMMEAVVAPHGRRALTLLHRTASHPEDAGMTLLIRTGPSGILLCVLLSLFAAPARAADAPVFEKTVLPLLQAKCVRCHGGDKLKADLDVRSRAALVKGGESGSAVVPGSPEKSLLWVKVAADKMPPNKDKLSESEKAVVRAWINAGA